MTSVDRLSVATDSLLAHISPSNASQLTESLHGSDDDDDEAVGGKRVRSPSVTNIDDDSLEDVEAVEESDEAKCSMTPVSISKSHAHANVNAVHLSKDWNAPIYAFFHPVPSIDYVGNLARHVHVFKCNAKVCKGKGMNWRHVWRYLDTADGRLTSNLRCHAKICWGEEAITGADATKSHCVAHENVEKSLRMLDGSITAMFEHIKGKGSVTYSHRQHTKTESRYVMVEPHLSHIPMLIFITSTEII
jgi:hypothetical protein